MSLSAATLTEDKMKSTVEALSKLQLEPASAALKREPTEVSDDQKPLPQKAFGQHKNIPCASECVDIAYNPSVGRHIVANRDIDPGMVLFVEEPYASLLEPDCHFTHCNNCSKLSDAMIPCRKCDQVMYCSESCRKASWESCHRIECRVFPALRSLDVMASTTYFLALRVFMIACSKHNGIVGLFNLVKKLDQRAGLENDIKGLNEKLEYLSSDYQQIHYLHRYIKNELSARITWVVVAASMVNCILKYTDIICLDSNERNIVPVNLFNFTADFILKTIQACSTNAYARGKVKELSVGLYSTLSLLNHSCDPSSFRSYQNGDVQVVIAKQPIRKGEEVSASYGIYFDESDKTFRQDHLRLNYGFDCQCIACANNWPKYSGLESLDDPTFICKTCRIPLPKKPWKLGNQWVKCTQCNTKYNVSRMHAEIIIINQRYNYLVDVKNANSMSDAKAEITSFIKTIDSTLLNPNQLMNNCQEYVRGGFTGGFVV